MTDPAESNAIARSSLRPKSPVSGRTGVLWKYLGVTLAAVAMLLAAAIPAAAAELMRVTFVRHGQSAGNASGLIDTSTPGPVLTELGQQQARAVVGKLGDNNYDAIYASTMVRTQLTAAPMSQYLGLPIQVLPGLQEIEAGVFEGTPESQASSGYGLYPIAWALPGAIPNLPFDKGTKMPGTDLDGYAFDARVDGALQTMYDNGDRNAIVFSHGGTIMFWTMMNANNLTIADKLQLLQTAPLSNTDYVVIEGNPEDGWTLVNWNGRQFSTEPTLQAEVQLQLRTLTRQLSATARQVSASFDSRDLPTIATALNRGVADATHSVTKFQRAVTAKVIHEIDKVVPKQPADSSVQELKSSVSESASLKTADGSGLKERLATLKRDAKTAADDKPATAATRPGKRLRDAVSEVNNQVTKSVDKLSDSVKKRVTGAGTTASDSGSKQRDAA